MAERIRVVITGREVVSPLGLNIDQTWNGLIEGRNGIGRISHEVDGKREGAVNSEVDIAGLVKDFDPSDYFSKKDLRRIHRSAQFSTVACGGALSDADLLDQFVLKNVNPERIGMRIGTGIGGGSEIAEIEDVIRIEGDQKISPLAILNLLSERVVTVPGMKFGIKGPCSAVVAACASGSIAIGDAREKIILGKADVMLGGGSEAAVHRVGIGAFNAIGALNKNNEHPETASSPFDEKRNGFVMAEGAGVLVLERLEHALERNTPHIYAEVIGYSETADAFHDVVPSGEGAVRAMRLALVEAEIEPEEVDYINTHGTSTPVGDIKEKEALEAVFGKYLKNISISSTKSAHGHLLGAAGGLEAVICCKAIETQIVPPTLNLRNPIDSALDFVALKAKSRRVIVAMSNSFGFGGLNSVLILRQYFR